MKYIVLVFLGACSYGILSTFVKIAYDNGFTVGEVVGSQALIGLLMTWIYALAYPRVAKSVKTVTRTKIKPSQVLKLIAVGTTAGSTSIVYYGALQYITASLAIILLFQFTWLGVLLEAIVNRKRPESAKVYALIVLLIGTVFASGISGNSLHGVSWIGIGLGLLSAISYTLFIFFSGKVAVELSAATRTALMLTGAAVLIMIVFPPLFLINGSLSQGLWIWGGLIAFFGALIPPLFFNIGVPHIGSGLATILGAAELPVAVSMAFIVLHESVSVIQWISVVVILIGVALPELLQFRNRRSKKVNGATNP